MHSCVALAEDDGNGQIKYAQREMLLRVTHP